MKFDVTISVDKAECPITGQMLEAASETVTVEAPREGLAKTRAMVVTTIKARGRLVSYILKVIS
jgi:hypothetical protein